MDFDEDYEEEENGDDWNPVKSDMKDEKGRYIVQGLFIEDRYNTNLSMYTFDGEDKEYKGETYPSLKRLYLDMADVKEYSFANKYLYDWPHWKRLCANSIIGRHISDWREELELMLESEAQIQMLSLAEEGSYQAVKYVADKGWTDKRKGRPTKAQVEQELEKAAVEKAEYDEDFKLLEIKGGKT